jgi:hypothetical protein
LRRSIESTESVQPADIVSLAHVDGGHVADLHSKSVATRTLPQLVDHRGRQFDSIDRHTAFGQGESDAARADGELERSTFAGNLGQEVGCVCLVAAGMIVVPSCGRAPETEPGVEVAHARSLVDDAITALKISTSHHHPRTELSICAPSRLAGPRERRRDYRVRDLGRTRSPSEAESR